MRFTMERLRNMAWLRFRKPMLRGGGALSSLCRFAILAVFLLSVAAIVRLQSPQTVDKAYDYVVKTSSKAYAHVHTSTSPPAQVIPARVVDRAPSRAPKVGSSGGSSSLNSSQVGDYLNLLVDRYKLSTNMSWYGRRIQPDFKRSKGYGRPSLTKLSKKFQLQAFAKVHAPGHTAIQEQKDKLERIKRFDKANASYAAKKRKGKPSPTPVPELEPKPTPTVEATITVQNMTQLPIESAVVKLPMSRRKQPSNVDASILLFGISSTFTRLKYDDFALIDDWARWLTDGRGHSNGATLFLSLHQPRSDEADTIRRLLKAHGIDFHLHIDTGNPPKADVDRKLRQNRGREIPNQSLKKRDTIENQENEEEEEANEPEPIVPDPAPIRYASLLAELSAYGQARANNTHHNSTNNKDANNPTRNATAERLQASRRNAAKENLQKQSTQTKHFYALVEDDVFFPSMDKLLSKLKMYAGMPPNPPATSDGSIPDDLWLGFPSDPRSDWVFRNQPSSHFGAAPAGAADGTARNTTTATANTTVALTYGGSAVFLSPALAHRAAALTCLRRPPPFVVAKDHGDDDSGDDSGDDENKEDDQSDDQSNGDDGDDEDDDDDAVAAAIHRAMMAGVSARAAAATEETWDARLHRCLTSKLHTTVPGLHLRAVPSFYAPSDLALYTSYQHHHATDAEARLVARLQQYSGGTQPLALHNYRAWHNFPAGAGHRVASVCGEECFLQRFRFADDWVLVNGHSLTHYPQDRATGARGVEAVPLHRLGKAGGWFSGSGGGVGGDGLSSMPNPSPFDDPDFYKSSDDGGRWGFVATFLDKFVGGGAPGGGGAGIPAYSERARAYAAQQRAWFGQRTAVEEPERPDDLQVLLASKPGTRRTWKLLDSRTMDSGTVVQAYARLRPQSPARPHPRTATAGMAWPVGAAGGVPDVAGEDADSQAEEAIADDDEDSVIVLLWEA